jgi:hypothetical protein
VSLALVAPGCQPLVSPLLAPASNLHNLRIALIQRDSGVSYACILQHLPDTLTGTDEHQQNKYRACEHLLARKEYCDDTCKFCGIKFLVSKTSRGPAMEFGIHLMPGNIRGHKPGNLSRRPM